jgi:hypothetical protein
MNRIAKLAVPLLSLGLALLGCSEADEPIVDATPVAAVAAAETTPAEASPIDQPAAPDVAESQKSENAVAEYTPPFPQRLELFEPQQRAAGTARRDDGAGQAVELKGFIEVDEPRVILAIDGVVSSVPEGGEKYGVRVLSIEPPTVVLQRGGGRPWPATLD